jgi:hypothetical protein
MTSSHPAVFHYRGSKKHSRCKPSICSRNVPHQTSDGGILPQGFLPSERDILCGRGKAFVGNNGNKYFSDIVRKNLHRYVDAPKRLDKSRVVASVVSEILSSGARFVKQEKISGRWYQMNENQAHEKTGHAIRDLIKFIADGGTDNSSIARSSKINNNKSSISSKSALAKMYMLKASESRRSICMEPMNVLAKEFCLNSFESEVSTNFGFSSGGLLKTVLDFQEDIDDDPLCAPALLPVVSDEVFPAEVVGSATVSLQINCLDDLDEVTISEDFFSTTSRTENLMDDLSVDHYAPSHSRSVLTYSHKRPSVTPNANDFARVYELLSSDDESCAGE